MQQQQQKNAINVQMEIRVDGLKEAQPESTSLSKNLNPTLSNPNLDPGGSTQPVFSSQKRVQPEKSGRVWPH